MGRSTVIVGSGLDPTLEEGLALGVSDGIVDGSGLDPTLEKGLALGVSDGIVDGTSEGKYE